MRAIELWDIAEENGMILLEPFKDGIAEALIFL